MDAEIAYDVGKMCLVTTPPNKEAPQTASLDNESSISIFYSA